MPESTSQNPSEKAFDISSNVPLVYADHALGINVGNFTSRIVFGTEVSPGNANAAITVVMPTGTMIQLAQYILQAFAGSELSEKLIQGNKEYVATLTNLAEQKK